MDMADHCAILPNERINPRFGRAAHAIESSESRKIAPLIKGGPLRNPPARTDHPTVGKHATARIEILAFGTGPTHHATNGASEPAQLTRFSILSTKDSNSQVLNRAHLWILWTIKHSCDWPDLHPHVVFVRVACRSA